jgi:hypothetical protein
MRPGQERGEGAVGYLAVILLIGSVVAVLVTAGIGGQVAGGIEAAVCTVAGGEDCGSGGRTTPAGPPTGSGEPGPSTLPTPPPGGQSTGPVTTAVPRPTPGPPVQVPPDPQAQVRAETEAVLAETPLGRDALDWIRGHQIPVIYRPGGGSYFSVDDNVIYVDTNQSATERAGTLVHEVNHARNRYLPDPKKMGRDEFIDKSIDEETDGTVRQIQANQQLQAVRGPGTVPDHHLQGAYETAYNKAVKDENRARAKLNLPPMTPEQERLIGEAAGRRRVKEAFEKGEVITSTDGSNYRDYYGHDWDDSHDCVLWIFC